MESSLLMIFVKNPLAGKVKTRLAKDVGDEQALELYLEMLKHTALQTSNLPMDKVVYYSTHVEKEDVFSSSSFQKSIQHNGDLGEKMHAAFEENFKKGYKRIVIIGSDCVELKTNDIQEAFQLLTAKDAVIGPAKDGGYYLLGLNEPVSLVFQHKEWSTSSVFKKTYLDLLSLNKSIGLLGEKSDIDTLADLEKSTLQIRKLDYKI
jgi:rSAM/selenodomain-associated transferase 1